MYKIYIKFNKFGQPCGLRAANFANYIAYLAKKGDISFRFTDWRQEDQKHKLWDVLNVMEPLLQLFTSLLFILTFVCLKLQMYFNIDPLCKDWVMSSAGKKLA